MGYGTFDSGASSARSAFRKSTGTSAFVVDADIKAGRRAVAVHETLDLTKKPKRECRDNSDNPLAIPVAIMVDVTGSMGDVADLVIDGLHKIMTVIKDRKIVEHPSICFGAIGDATCDRVPIQMGEFESDDELAESHLSNIYREGGGGGQVMESYELALWFFANQVETDHWDKRGEKGFLFIIGDEAPYDEVNPDHIKSYCGEDVSEAISLETIATKLQERWHVFCLRPGGTSHFDSNKVQSTWLRALPAERVIKVEDWHEINSLIAGTISVMSGITTEDTLVAIKDANLKTSTITSTVLATLANSASLVAAGVANSGGSSDSVERL